MSDVKVDFHAGFQFSDNNIDSYEEFTKSRHFMFLGTDNSLFENIDFERVWLITSMRNCQKQGFSAVIITMTGNLCELLGIKETLHFDIY